MPIVSDSKFEKLFFFLYYFNMDISFNIPWKKLKFEIHVNEGCMEGTVSQILYLDPSFCFIKSRTISLKNQKLPVFWDKTKTKT